MDCAEPEPKAIAERLRRMGISSPYAWQIAHKKRPPSLDLAFRIWRETGFKFGRLAGKSDVEVQALASIVEAA